MSRQRLSQIIGVASPVLLVLGAALYAINSPHRTLTFGMLGGGGVLLVAYVLLNLRLVLELSKRRSSRYGANLVVMIVLFTCIVVIVQALSARHNLRYDVTANKRFSLAPQTLNVLAALDKDLRVFAFYSQGSDEGVRAEEILGQFAYHSPHFRYEMIDPDRRPMRATELGVEDYGTLVLQYGERRERITTLSEESLTNAVLKVARTEVKKIYFVKGHGERDITSREPGGSSAVRGDLRDGNYSVEPVSLFDEPGVPEDCAVLVVAGPQTDYFDSEVIKITDYLGRAGNAVLLLDARVDVPNLEGLLAQYGVGVNNDVIIDPYSRIFGGDYTVPVVGEYTKHAITRDLDLATFFPMARSVRIDDSEIADVTAQYLASTGNSAWGERDLEGVRKGQAVRDESDVPAPVPVALIATRQIVGAPDAGPTAQSSMLLVGDSDFIANSYLDMAGNADFFLNAINFLAEEKDLVAIRAKRGMGDRLFLTASQGRLIFLLCVIMLPSAVIAAGTSVFFRRRRKG